MKLVRILHAARTAARDATPVTIDRHFATADARTKLKRLYPSLEPWHGIAAPPQASLYEAVIEELNEAARVED